MIDETGKIYGRLTVIGRAASNKDGQAQWCCLCTCGNDTVVRGRSLRTGGTRSCGCLVHDTLALPKGEASFNQLYSMYRHDARRRRPSRKWNLNKEQFREIVTSACHYCGTEPHQRVGQPANNGYFYYNGVDRVDSSRGYNPDNVVPCCKFCNYAKRDHTYQEFLGWLERAYKHNFEMLQEAQ